MKFVTPIILTAIALVAFFMFTVPTFNEFKAVNQKAASYDEALGNSKALEYERDKLTQNYNAFSKTDLARLAKMLPEHVDNIRLILEIEQLAAPYGMAVRGVSYNAADAGSGKEQGGVVQGGTRKEINRGDYGVFDLEFTVSASYDNFVNFIRDLENNLRLVDVSAITFSSSTALAGKSGGSSPETYDYNIKLKTYWLKK